MKRILRAGTAALALAVAALPAAALDLSNMTDSEKAAFGAAVHDYLMKNPEVLVEAINELQQRQQTEAAKGDQALIAENAQDLFQSSDDWVGGNPQGDLTIVEFMDYKCGYCKKAFPDVTRLLKDDGKIRFVVKEFPILGPQSELGARFAIAVRQVAGDAAYGKVHNALMAFRGDITEASLKKLATDQGLDAAAVMGKMTSDSVTNVIKANYALAQKLKIDGTPGFIIGKDVLRGYAPYDQMKEIVAEERS